MAYQITDWALSDIPAEEIRDQKNVSGFTENGLKTVKILDVKYLDDSAEKVSDRFTYRMSIECIEGGTDAGARATLTYWLKEKDSPYYSSKTLGTMQSLGRAIFGPSFPEKAVPMPGDIIGAVVMADINLKTDALGRTFTRAFKFEPAGADFSAFSDIEQYYREVADGNPGGSA